MFCILGGISVVAHLYNLNSIKSKTVGDGQHGTARWATKSEIRKTYRHIPFTPNKWRNQAADGETPTASRIVKRRLFKSKKKEQPEEALSQGIVVGCTGGKHNTTALVDTGDVHVLMIGAAGVGKRPIGCTLVLNMPVLQECLFYQLTQRAMSCEITATLQNSTATMYRLLICAILHAVTATISCIL